MSRYIVSIKFLAGSNVLAQLAIFDAIKKLGTFSIQDQKDHVYILLFRSEFTTDGLEERLKEIAGPAGSFNYTVCGFDEIAENGKFKTSGH
ncbi:MAG TPA: hypothetical protein DER10_01250 [Elusimicrobia bacterium]|nr:hypothetical protein [Elusimicrobiota bacterium]